MTTTDVAVQSDTVAERDVVRPGPGGPKLTKVVARLTDEERDKLEAYAARWGLTLSRAVAKLVRDSR